MPSLIKSLPSLAVIALLVQPSPARFVSLLPKLVGGMGPLGNLIGHIGNPEGSVVPSMNNTIDYEIFGGIQRISPGDTTLPVPNQLAWQICRGQLQIATVNFSGPAPGDVLVTGIPPACMTLLTVLTDEHSAGSPVPEGTDSALFTNLSEEEINEIQVALDARV